MIQLGTRWPFGSTSPARLAGEVAQALSGFEDSLRSEVGDEVLAGAVWTLTWLEGRPIMELDRDRVDGSPIVLTVDARGEIATPVEDDDAW